MHKSKIREIASLTYCIKKMSFFKIIVKVLTMHWNYFFVPILTLPFLSDIVLSRN